MKIGHLNTDKSLYVFEKSVLPLTTLKKDEIYVQRDLTSERRKTNYGYLKYTLSTSHFNLSECH